MRELTYLIIVALASLLVAPPFSAFAQRERGPPRFEGRRLAAPTPLRPQTFGGRVDMTAAPPPPPPQRPKHAFYYHPGDLRGVPYNTIEDCTKARQRAGDVGVCVYK